MEQFQSRIDVSSGQYKENAAQYEAVLERLRNELEASRSEGKPEYLERHKAQGKFPARERIERLIDPKSEFFELLPFAGHSRKDSTVGAAIVAGVGKINGQDCMICANVPTIKGGALNPITVRKLRRIAVISQENRLPFVYLVESAGADLLNQAEIYNYGGAEFRDIARRSKLGIPTIAIVFGSSTAGGAYIPGLADYVIMVNEQAKVYLAGPPLVKMAINETVNDEDLGGAHMHATKSGLADFLAQDEAEAINLARDIVEFQVAKKYPDETDSPQPVLSPEEIPGIIPADIRQLCDPKEIIARIVDESKFLEFKPLFGKTLVTAFAKIAGQRIGILANRGVLVSDAANKGAHFIQLCNQQSIPLLFLQNITGFMVGKDAETGGIIKDGAKLINAVANSQVPAITIITGASYGAGNYAMCGLAYEPRFLFAWPHAKLAVMGPDQLSGVMEILQREKARKAGAAVDEAAIAAANEKLRAKIDGESDAFFCSGQAWDDGIIDPRDTRKVLETCLRLIARNPVESDAKFGVFRL